MLFPVQGVFRQVPDIAHAFTVRLSRSLVKRGEFRVVGQSETDPLPNSLYRVSVRASVCLLILAVRSSLSQLKGLPSMARFTVLNRTTEKSWR